MITANEIVEDISKGVIKALRTSELLLGVEGINTDYPRIEPEYLITDEVARQLSEPNRTVGIETHMDDLRTNAHRKAILDAFRKYGSRKDPCYNQRIAEIDTSLANPQFQFSGNGSGKKRIDIAVFSFEREPLLIAEAKLGSQGASAIIADIDRVIKLLNMHKELAVFDNLYGAIFFYRMLNGGSDGGVRGRAKPFLTSINTHLKAEKGKPDQTWIRAKADLLTRGSVAGPVEVHETGTRMAVLNRSLLGDATLLHQA